MFIFNYFSIRKLVHGADKLVFIQTPIDDSDVDYRPQSELSLHRPPKTNRSHSFHATSSKHLYSSDNVVISSAEEDSDHEVGMDCERDSLNPSLKDASSLQGYIYIRFPFILQIKKFWSLYQEGS